MSFSGMSGDWLKEVFIRRNESCRWLDRQTILAEGIYKWLGESICYKSLKFLNLMMNSKLILTDSGGIQEEASYLKIPILTARMGTERPVTVEEGTNTIIGNDIIKAKRYIQEIFSSNYKKGKDIEKWDRQTAIRIVQVIKRKFNI